MGQHVAQGLPFAVRDDIAALKLVLQKTAVVVHLAPLIGENTTPVLRECCDAGKPPRSPRQQMRHRETLELEPHYLRVTGEFVS
jgi:hypothetical protein